MPLQGDNKHDGEVTHEQGVERMNRQSTSHSARIVASLLVAALLLTAGVLAGCGGTDTHPGGPSGTGAPAAIKAVPDSVRGEVLDTLKSLGVTFDEGMVSVVYGVRETHIIVDGVLTGPKVLAAGAKGPMVKYSQINLDLVNGKWVVGETK